MKELYIAPEAEIICFAPVEELAWEASWNYPGGSADGSEFYNTEDINPGVNGDLDPET